MRGPLSGLSAAIAEHCYSIPNTFNLGCFSIYGDYNTKDMKSNPWPGKDSRDIIGCPEGGRAFNS